MDLKEFVKETIAAIADATMELQEEYEDRQVLVNPPAPHSGSDVYQEGSASFTFRRVRDVEFDVALTVGSEARGKGKAGIKILSAEIGGGAEMARTKGQVSRVKFSIPLSLRPTSAEEKNVAIKENQNFPSQTINALTRNTRSD